MRTLQEQFNLINEGKGHKDVFLKSARRLFPEYITNFATYNEAVKILKQKSVLVEAAGGVVTQRTFDPFQTFNQFVSEASTQENPIKAPKATGAYDTKAVNTKLSKEVEINQKETGYDNTNKDIIDNVYGQAFLEGYYAEMKDPKNEDKSVDQLKEIVRKNLAKSPTYYAENAAFGIKGIGYTKDAPGLGEPKAPKGKYKSSGYGDLKENKENKPENPYSLYKSHPKFKEAEQAIAKALKTATKREDVENILKNYREAGADDTASREAIFAAFNKKLRESETRSVGPMIKSKEFKVGDKVKYKGMNHEITRIVEDRIYIKNLKYGGRPDTWDKASDLKENKPGIQNTYNQEIDWIKYEVDYVPDDEEVYKKWPEPYRSRALKALESRKKNFNTMSKEKLDSLKESKLRSLVRNLIKEELNEGYGMSLEDAKAEAQRISQEEGVVQHVEETSEGSGEYRVSDWYDSDLTVASYQNGMEL